MAKKMKNEISYANSSYYFLKEDLLNHFGSEKGFVLFNKTEHYLLELADNYTTDNVAMQTHFYKKMLPVISLYKTLLSEGYSEDEAYNFTKVESEKNGMNMNAKNESLGKKKWAYTAYRLFVKSHMTSHFPAPWFLVDWVRRDSNEIHFNMTKCVYHETCVKEGCEELCTLFCNHDDVAFSGLIPNIRFERSGTIGKGNAVCDFHFRKGL